MVKSEEISLLILMHFSMTYFRCNSNIKEFNPDESINIIMVESHDLKVKSALEKATDTRFSTKE